MRPKKNYGKTKAAIGVGAGVIASVVGLALLPAAGIGVGTWLFVRWIDN